MKLLACILWHTYGLLTPRAMVGSAAYMCACRAHDTHVFFVRKGPHGVFC